MDLDSWIMVLVGHTILTISKSVFVSALQCASISCSLLPCVDNSNTERFYRNVSNTVSSCTAGIAQLEPCRTFRLRHRSHWNTINSTTQLHGRELGRLNHGHTARAEAGGVDAPTEGVLSSDILVANTACSSQMLNWIRGGQGGQERNVSKDFSETEV